MTFNEFCEKHSVTDDERDKLINLLMAIKFNGRLKFLYTELLMMIQQIERVKEPIENLLNIVKNR